MTVLSDADFYAPLKTNLLLTKGSGVATTARSTTKNIFNDDGILITLNPSVRAFQGARCVQNFSPASESFDNNLIWQKYGSVSTPSANKIVCSTLNTAQYIFAAISTYSTSLSGFKFVSKFRVEYVDIQYVQIAGRSTVYGNGQYCNFDLINGDYTAVGCTANIEAVSPGIWDISVLMTTLANGDPASAIVLVSSQTATYVQNFTGDGIKSVNVLRHQLENVTGKADQTASEYVSVGVLSTPWHGAGVDGVKFFNTKKDGTTIPDTDLLGDLINSSARINNLKWCRDFTNAVWVKNNITPTKNQTGIDATANSCTLLTATTTDATVLQTITAASTPACSSFYVKRSVGTGSIYFTRDGGSNWADITSLINSSAFTRVKIENTSVTNPQIGFKIATSGDAIIVDYGQNEAGTEVSMPILTTSANVTRNADSLTYQTLGNFSDTSGTILATVMRENWANNNGSVVGSSTHGLYTSASNSGAQALDGTNTVNGPAGSIITQRKIGMKWSGSSLKVFAGGIFGSVGSYDGSFNLSTVAIMPGTQGYIRDVAIWQSSLSDADMLSAASFQTDTGAAGIGAATITNNYINSISAVASGAGGGSFANNYIHSVDASASGLGLSAITNNYIHSISAFADGVGGLSAEAIAVKNIISSQSIQISYYQPRITISI